MQNMLFMWASSPSRRNVFSFPALFARVSSHLAHHALIGFDRCSLQAHIAVALARWLGRDCGTGAYSGWYWCQSLPFVMWCARFFCSHCTFALNGCCTCESEWGPCWNGMVNLITTSVHATTVYDVQAMWEEAWLTCILGRCLHCSGADEPIITSVRTVLNVDRAMRGITSETVNCLRP